MKNFYKKSELKNYIQNLKNKNKKIGFVPTMGTLHDGHLSLIKKSKNNNDITVVSIFVNPTQFNDKNDFKNYPREFESDLNKIAKLMVDIVFMPSEKEMYPKEDNRKFDFGYLDKIMEGNFREGHFEGVAKIVTKLFDIVMPYNAYFGEKDYQQLTIIKKLVADYNYNINIVPCPIVRENDGLAMSSRNLRLNKKEREIAPYIYQILKKSVKLSKNNSINELINWVELEFKKNTEFILEYFKIVNDDNLMEVNEWEEKGGKIGCVAVWLGSIRLIDNIKYNL